MSGRDSARELFVVAPRLHRSAIIATLQLITWLFLRPTAWREHIRRLDKTLSADFCMTQLSSAQLRNAGIRQLFVRGHIIGPFLASLVLAVELWILGVSGWVFVLRVGFCAMAGTLGGVVAGAGTTAAAGIAIGFVAALTGSLAFGVATALFGHLQFAIVGGVAGVVADFARGGASGTVALAVAGGVAAGIVFISDSGLAMRQAAAPGESKGSTGLSGLLIGLIVGGFYFVVALLAALWLPFPSAVGITGFLAAAMVSRSRGVSGSRSLLYGIFCGATNYLSAKYMIPALQDVVVVGTLIGALLGGWFSVPYLISERVGGPVAGAAAGAAGLSGGWILVMSSGAPNLRAGGMLTYLSSTPGFILLGLLLLFFVVLGTTHAFWQPILIYPFEEAWNLFLYRLDRDRLRHPSLLRLNAAFWDELQRRRLYSLERHLLLVLERDPAEGRAALEALAAGPQRWVVQAVQIEIDLRRLAECKDAAEIAKVQAVLGVDELAGPTSALLRGFARISQDVQAALAQGTPHNQRLGLAAAEQRLEQFLGELSRSSESYAARFQPAALSWNEIVRQHARKLAEAAEQCQELDNPYVIGVPLTLQQEIFVGRADIGARIEHLLLDRRRPPLLLCGQRRMGKTSLLNNLGRLLRSSIVPLFVDLQGPASAAADHAGLLYNLARGMADSARIQRGLTLPRLNRNALTADPFTAFDEWLDAVEGALGPHTALLCLDELEALDRALATGRFSEAQVLGMLRHIVQHRPRFKILLATSSSVQELQRWSSYLINVQVVQMSYLREEEARQLIERPVPDMMLHYDEDASSLCLALTRGHPFLIQLLCSEIVSLKNEQEPALRRRCTAADVEEAVPAALQHGSFFFVDIEQNQIGPSGLKVLELLAAAGPGRVTPWAALSNQGMDEDELKAALARLRLRDLIEEADGGLRFQVEMIRRWFEKRT